MWNKMIKTYIKGIFILALFIAILYLFIGSRVHDIFVSNYMFDIKEVEHFGRKYIQGVLDWDILKAHLFIYIFLIYSILFFTVYILINNNHKNQKNEYIMQLTERIKQMKKEDEPPYSSECLGFDGEVRELIEQKRTLEDEFERQRGEYNHSMLFLAHDLKTPLTTIIGYLTLMKDNEEIIMNRGKYIDVVYESSRELEKLINQFFELSKYSLDTRDLSLENIDLNSFFIQIQETFYPEISEKKLELSRKIPDNTIISVDRELFARAFLNIMKNSVRYADTDTTITIKAERNNNKIVIEVINSSKRIDIDISKIFNAFYRGDQSGTNTQEGSGLGLAIAKTIIEKHKGNISAYQKADIFIVKVDVPII